MQLFERLLAFIAPHTCRGCEAEGSVLCGSCSMALLPIPSRCYRCHRATLGFQTCATCRKYGLFAAFACTPYEGMPKVVLQAFKYERAQAAAQDIAVAIARRMPSLGKGVVITHVPTVTTRVRARGYDQAALIAKSLARLTHMSYAPLLVRQGEGRQVGQTRRMRRQQMQRAFYAVRPDVLQKQHILLVDDVLTTGATCEAAAQTLRQAGARRVSVVVFAAA